MPIGKNLSLSLSNAIMLLNLKWVGGGGGGVASKQSEL